LAGTGNILSDGSFIYSIGPKDDLRKFVRIERNGADGSNELWDCDNNNNKGVETVKDSKGITRKTTWFTSGVLARSIRSIEEIDKTGKTVAKRQFSYNNEGKILREYDNGSLTTYYERTPRWRKRLQTTKLFGLKPQRVNRKQNR